MSTVSDDRDTAGLTDLAARLRDRIPVLVDHILGAGDPPWPDGVPPATLRRATHDHLAHLLDGLQVVTPAGGGPLPGAARGVEDLPPGVVLRLFRGAAHLLWAVLQREGPGAGVDAGVLVDGATRLWALHAAACAEAEAAYVAEPVGGGPDRERSRREALVTALLDGRADARRAAAWLRLRPVGRYAVVVADDRGGDELEGRLARDGFPSAWRRLPGGRAGVVDLGGADLAALAAALVEAGDGRIGVSAVVRHLADLPTARWHAEAALATVPPGERRVAVLEWDLPGALLASSPDLAALLVERLAPALELDEGERDALLETVETYAATGASATATARTVHCHRNTVLNRVKRFEALCGWSLDSPAALVTAWLATRAHALGLEDR